MDDAEILARIQQMVQAEHELRARLQDGGGAGSHAGSQAAGQLKALEESLDQCWDLLRQRRARREFAQDPDESHVRPTNEVEGYLQ